MQYLKDRYEMRVEKELKWFLGIRVVRDRPNRWIYLCQDTYIEKIVNRFGLIDAKQPSIPLSPIPLERTQGRPANSPQSYTKRR